MQKFGKWLCVRQNREGERKKEMKKNRRSIKLHASDSERETQGETERE